MPAASLPVPPTALLGRETDVAAVTSALTAPGSRLITVTGPPGVGKTRLALAAAAAVQDHFPAGTAWVDLSPVADARLVLPEIARAVGVSRSAAEPTLGRLARAVADRELLIVLDNCEHLLDAVPEIGALLASSPFLRILATSRERLYLTAEHEYVLAPLRMPTEDEVTDVDRLRRNPAMSLLLARSPAHVAITTRTARSLADVCVGLDGLPLAIELAAARLRVFTPSELAFRLEHRMDVLTGGSRDAPGRHRNLRAAITWSHDLLPDAERALFRRLSVFVGDWTVAAAEAVCGDPAVGGILDAVQSLLDKSLIRRVAGEAADARFGMLVSLREFAAEQLELHGEAAETRARHTHYFAATVRGWEATLGTNAEIATWPRVGFMRGDLQSALEHSRIGPDFEETLWLATGLGWYWYTRGSLADAAVLLEVAEADAARSSPEVRTAALVAAGIVSFGLGDLDAAEGALLRSAELSGARDDRRRLAVSSAFLGHVARLRGRFDDAATRYATARTIYEQDGHTQGTAWAAHDLGLLAIDLGRPADAETHLREALRLFHELDYDWAVAVTAGLLATVLLRAGTVDEPAQLLAEALVGHDGVGDRRGIAQCLEALGEVALARGTATIAAQLLGAAAAERDAVAAPPTDAERDRLGRLEREIARTLGSAAADQERRSGRTLAASAAVALAARVAAGGVSAGGAAAGGVAAGGDAVSKVELTPRQREVAVLVAASNTNRQIGRALGISEKTAEIHVRNLMVRLDTPSRAGVAAWATAHGLRPLP